MARTKIDFRSGSKANYLDFCKKHPDVDISFVDWKNIVYTYNDMYRIYILETGEKVKMPMGLGQFSINKKKRKRRKGPNGEYINMAVDWQKSKALGKRIYILNHHTDGYFFGWMWFNTSATIKFRKLWYFKPYRVSSRLIAHYIKVDEKYQHIYKEWKS